MSESTVLVRLHQIQQQLDDLRSRFPAPVWTLAALAERYQLSPRTIQRWIADRKLAQPGQVGQTARYADSVRIALDSEILKGAA